MYRIAEENSKKAFLLLDQMEKEGSLSLQSISLTMGDLTNQFLKGKIGIMFNSSMAIDSIREGNPDLEFGVAPIPGGETSVSVAGGEILAVAENEKKEYAIRFLKFLADKDRMKEYIDAVANNILDNETPNIGSEMVRLSKEEVKKMTERENQRKELSQKAGVSDMQDVEIGLASEKVPKKKKDLSELTEEERRRRKKAILRKRKLMQEREAQKNGKKEE